jgi:DNA-binding IclR family transcriptional regulator
VFEELLKTFEECREPNWDGYGTYAVREETYSLARQFLAALSLSTAAHPLALNRMGTLLWNGIEQRNKLCP